MFQKVVYSSVQIDVKETKKNSFVVNVFVVIAIILIIGIPIYGYFKLKPDSIFNSDSEITEDDTTEPTSELSEEQDIEETEEDIPEPLPITGYTEELIEIEKQWAYILAPDPIDTNYPPTLVIYNHGSDTVVEEDLDEDFKNDLIEYGEALTPYNYIFAVSNAQGFDLDSDEAIVDNYNLYNYIKDNYEIEDKIYMMGYSKGGVATLNFADQYPDLVTKIAMIAARMRLYEWDENRAQSLRDIDIKVWHGTDDVNVSFTNTTNFIDQMSEWGIKIDLVTLEGKTHWNVEIEYLDEMVDFLNSSETDSE